MVSLRSGLGTYLIPQFLIDCFVTVWTELLLQEREQHGDDDASLECFPEDDEKDGDGEDVDHGE